MNRPMIKPPIAPVNADLYSVYPVNVKRSREKQQEYQRGAKPEYQANPKSLPSDQPAAGVSRQNSSFSPGQHSCQLFLFIPAMADHAFKEPRTMPVISRSINRSLRVTVLSNSHVILASVAKVCQQPIDQRIDDDGCHHLGSASYIAHDHSLASSSSTFI